MELQFRTTRVLFFTFVCPTLKDKYAIFIIEEDETGDFLESLRKAKSLEGVPIVDVPLESSPVWLNNFWLDTQKLNHESGNNRDKFSSELKSLFEKKVAKEISLEDRSKDICSLHFNVINSKHSNISFLHYPPAKNIS